MAISTSAQKILQARYRIPSITAYNRLEAAPRAADLDAGLRAEIRDALWMLTRQWQFGEFQGEDAASPVSARILGEHTPIDRMSLAANPARAYDESIPMETAVEMEKLKDSLFLAVQIARYFLRLLRTKFPDSTYIPGLIGNYPIHYAIDNNDLDGLQLNNAVKAKLFDGCALIRDIRTIQGSGNRFSAWLIAQGVSQTDQDVLNGMALNLTAWFNRNYSQPQGTAPETAWIPSGLQYQFEVAGASGQTPQKVLSADQYYGDSLDWYDFDLRTDGKMTLPQESSATQNIVENLVSFIPSPVSFKGMPNPRFWMMEDSQTNFGRIDSSPTGLLHLLLAEFGLVYGNDWFMLPYPMAINNICEIKGLLVTDVFGEKTLVQAAGSGPESDWERWAMFHQTQLTAGSSEGNLFYLVPATGIKLENDPLEAVNFLRDPVADLVWAVEDRVPSAAGKGVSGDAMARTTTVPPPFVPAGHAAIRYVLGTAVPDNWIPFIPVHMEGSVTEIRFQRAAMPGAKGALGEVITETAAPYYINEEELPRSGIIVRRGFKRARWLNGKTFLWTGRVTEAGRGEGWSNLQFDQIVDIAPPALP